MLDWGVCGGLPQSRPSRLGQTEGSDAQIAVSHAGGLAFQDDVAPAEHLIGELQRLFAGQPDLEVIVQGADRYGVPLAGLGAYLVGVVSRQRGEVGVP